MALVHTMGVTVPVWYSVLAGLALRLALMVYGQWQDTTMAVKYTDVDYFVFSDAAEFVSKGESPYLRATYRYTPLLAWILQPNILSPVFGKLLFIICDVLAGYLIYVIVLNQNKKDTNTAVLCAETWLLNPLPMTISSRGNAESIMAVLVLISIHYLTKSRETKSKSDLVVSAAVYGLAVHTKIYPVTYALPIYLYLNDEYSRIKYKKNSWQLRLKQSLRYDVLPNTSRIYFIVVSVGVFVGLTAGCYYRYGWEFLQETYLHHVTRRDTRHNMSPYFYLYYLAGGAPSLALALAAFVPQVALLVIVSARFYEQLAFCCFLHTAVFVAFNKVCTSQYFLWYLSLLPLVLPRLQLSGREGALLGCLWALGQAAWLAPAYYLEFEGLNTFPMICAAGFGFFSINIWILHRLVQAYGGQRQLCSVTALVVMGTSTHRVKQQ